MLESKRMVKKSGALRNRIKTLVGELTSDFNDSFLPFNTFNIFIICFH